MATNQTRITTLLKRMNAGEKDALDELMRAVYDELRGLAARQLRRQYGAGAARRTLQPTALVHETFLRIIKQRAKYDNRGHFFALATRVMMRVLVDYERARIAQKRGGGRVGVSVEDIGGAAPGTEAGDSPVVSMEAFTHALAALCDAHPRPGEVAQLRLLWNLSNAEIAKALQISDATVERHWALARAWLLKELKDGADVPRATPAR